jgi:hypothetical protein
VAHQAFKVVEDGSIVFGRLRMAFSGSTCDEPRIALSKALSTARPDITTDGIRAIERLLAAIGCQVIVGERANAGLVAEGGACTRAAASRLARFERFDTGLQIANVLADAVLQADETLMAAMQIAQ